MHHSTCVTAIWQEAHGLLILVAKHVLWCMSGYASRIGCDVTCEYQNIQHFLRSVIARFINIRVCNYHALNIRIQAQVRKQAQLFRSKVSPQAIIPNLVGSTHWCWLQGVKWCDSVVQHVHERCKSSCTLNVICSIYKWVDFRNQQSNLLNHFVVSVAILDLNHLDLSKFQRDYILQHITLESPVWSTILSQCPESEGKWANFSLQLYFVYFSPSFDAVYQLVWVGVTVHILSDVSCVFVRLHEWVSLCVHY